MHPLHNEYILKCLDDQGESLRRRTGRSTAIGLDVISKAILSPGAMIPIKDHHGTRHADRSLALQITWMIKQLELMHLHLVSDSFRGEYFLILERRK